MNEPKPTERHSQCGIRKGKRPIAAPPEDIKVFDITKHRWRDRSVEYDDDYINITDPLHLYCGHSGEIYIEKRDAIAIAKHFGLIDPDNTYKSLNLDSVAEIKENELFNKEGDLHG